MNILSRKDNLRKRILEERDNLKKEEILKKSKLIGERLFAQDEFSEARVVMFYVSVGSEVSTHFMIKNSLKGGKKGAVPFCNMEVQELETAFINNLKEDLEPAAYGILEPKKLKRKKINLSQIELMIIPGIVFDLKGHRLGYGQGYYDKFLKKIPKACLIGLAFELQIVEGLPRFPHDIAVHKIITESRLIDTKKRFSF